MTHASAPTQGEVAIRSAVPTFLVADVASTAVPPTPSSDLTVDTLLTSRREPAKRLPEP
jgi:hypothetical protein